MRYNALQLIGSFHQGGSERQAVQLTRLLLEGGRCNVFVATLEREGVLLDEIEKFGLNEIPEFRLNSFYDLSTARQIWRFAQYLRKHEIDVVHAHDFYTNVFGMAARGARACAGANRFASRVCRSSGESKTGRTLRLSSGARRRRQLRRRASTIDQRRRAGAKGTHDLTTVSISRACNPRKRNATRFLAGLNLPQQARFVTIMANMRAHVTPSRAFLFQGPSDVPARGETRLRECA